MGCYTRPCVGLGDGLGALGRPAELRVGEKAQAARVMDRRGKGWVQETSSQAAGTTPARLKTGGGTVSGG